jgi:hypothetical protein
VKKLLSCMLLLVLTLFCGITTVKAESTTVFEYAISTSDIEWKSLSTKYEMVEALRIPESTLNLMSTQELVDAVIKYPLLVNLHLYDNFEIALQEFEKECDAFLELLTRVDAKDRLLEYRATLEIESFELESVKILLSSDNFIRTINYKAQNTSPLLLLTYPIYGTIYTPNGTAVAVVELEEYSQSYLDYLDNLVITTYPQATFVSSSTRKYNCHSYAWYSSSTSNTWWMDDPSAYMTDGSYTRVYSALSASKVHFPIGNHSMRIYDAYSNSLRYATVISKWGAGPVMIHNPFYSPYTTTGYTMWV